MVATDERTSVASADSCLRNEACDDAVTVFSNPAKYLFHVSKLTESLYLCGACAIRGDTFERLGITCVINCTTTRELSDPPLPDRVTTYLRISVLDSSETDLMRHFQRVLDIMEKVESEGGRILVHCVAGVSRSASICIAYLMRSGNLSLRDAYAYVEERRPCIKPNSGFFKQLIDFEIELRGGGVPSVSMVFDEASKSYIPDIYDHYSSLCGRKCNDKSCCQLNRCQKRQYGTR